MTYHWVPRLELFVDLPGIVAYEVLAGCDDLRGGAVIQVEDEFLGTWKYLLENWRNVSDGSPSEIWIDGHHRRSKKLPVLIGINRILRISICTGLVS